MPCRLFALAATVLVAAGCADPHGQADSILDEVEQVLLGVEQRYAAALDEVTPLVGPSGEVEPCPDRAVVPPLSVYGSRFNYMESDAYAIELEHRENRERCFDARPLLVSTLNSLRRRVGNHAPEEIAETLAGVRRKVALLDADALSRLLEQTETLAERWHAFYDLPGPFNAALRRYSADVDVHASDLSDMRSRIEESHRAYLERVDRDAELRERFDAAVADLVS